MDKIDFSPLQGTANRMVFELLKMGLLIVIVYAITYFLFKALRFPRQLRNFIATAVVLVVLYYALMNGYILQM